MSKFNIKTHWPILAGIAIIYVFAMIYFMPIMQGKVLQSHDMISSVGMSNDIKTEYKETGKYSSWTGSMFSGMPSFHFFDFMYVPNYLLIPFRALISEMPINYFIDGMLCFFIAMLIFGMNTWVALVDSIAFAFSTNHIVLALAGHYTKLGTIAFFPGILIGLLLIFRKKYLLGAAVFGLCASLNLAGGHIQMTYYLAFPMLVLGLIECIKVFKEKDFSHLAKSMGIIAVVAAVAIMSVAYLIMINRDYLKDTMRGGNILSSKMSGQAETSNPGLEWDYAMQWSHGPIDLLNTIVPGMVGGSNDELADPKSALMRDLRSKGANMKSVPFMYWGSLPFTSGPDYQGIILMALVFLGLFILKNELRWWMISGGALVLLMALGKHFSVLNHLLFDYFPLFNKFRAPSSIMPIFSFMVAAFATFTLNELITKKPEFADVKKPFLYSFGALAILLLLIILLGPSLFSFASDSDDRLAQQGLNLSLLQDLRAGFMRSDAIRSLLFLAIGGGMVWFYLKSKVNSSLLIGGLALLIIADLWTVNNRYLDAKNYKTAAADKENYKPRRSDIEILKDKDPNFRVFDMSVQGGPFNSSQASYFHKCIGGYSAIKLRRYQDVIDHHISQNNISVLNMLNTKYIVSQKNQIQQNPSALGNAWFVSSIKEVSSPDDEINALKGFNPSEEAIVLKSEFPTMVDGAQFSKTGSIKLTDYKTNHISYQSDNIGDGFAVFSEVWYRGNRDWKAYIDGKYVDHVRANYILRAMKIPAGTHKIEFKFEPVVFATAGLLTNIGSALIGLLVLIVAFFEIKKWKEQQS